MKVRTVCSILPCLQGIGGRDTCSVMSEHEQALFACSECAAEGHCRVGA